MGSVALYLFVLFVLFSVWQYGERLLRCSYCGRMAAHDEHCPRNGL